MLRKFLSFAILFLFSLLLGKAENLTKIHGTIQDATIKSIEYVEIQPTFANEFYDYNYKKVRVINSQVDLSFRISQPKVLAIYPPGFSWPQIVFLTPGDSVTFKVKELGKNEYFLEFSGRNAAHYNFNDLFRRHFFKEKHYWTRGEGFIQYKDYLNQLLNRELMYLSEFTTSNKVSDDFVRYAKAEILNEYVCGLYFPMSIYGIKANELPKDYFDNMKLEINLLSDNYKLALANKYIFHFTEDPLANFNLVYNNILNNFSGETRGFLISSMIGFYSKKQQLNYQRDLMSAIDNAPKYVTDSAFLDYIEKCKRFYTTIKRSSFPKNILDKTMFKSFKSNKKTNLRQLLSKYRGKFIYLDIWASWCGACRSDIANSKLLKKKFRENDIAWVYISMDENEHLWKTATVKDNIPDNQYLLCDNSKDNLMKYLNCKTIPRYLIIDKNGKVIELAAPRPYEGNILEYIKKYDRDKRVVAY